MLSLFNKSNKNSQTESIDKNTEKSNSETVKGPMIHHRTLAFFPDASNFSDSPEKELQVTSIMTLG